MITREQAYKKTLELISNQNLIKHCLAVEVAMNTYAKHFQINENDSIEWGIAGLIHDADWEKYPDKHPTVITDWLIQNGASDALINAVAAHGFEFGIEPKTLMAKTLRAVDELTGLIVAVALIKDKKLNNVTVSSIEKKWRANAFARGVKREDIEKGAREIEIPLNTHIGLVLSSMQQIASQLGL